MHSEHLSLSGFTRVRLSGAFQFEVVKAAQFGVDVEMAWYKNARAFTSSDTLIIDHPWYDVIAWFTPWIRPRAKVQMPELRELRVAGASRGSVTGFTSSGDLKLGVIGASHLSGDVNAGTTAIDILGASRVDLTTIAKDLKLSLAGASRYEGSLTADKAELRAVGASRIRAAGTVGDAVVRLAGASGLDGSLAAHNADVEAVGASHAALTVDGKLDVNLAGASRLDYSGSPTMRSVRTVGASTINKR